MSEAFDHVSAEYHPPFACPVVRIAEKQLVVRPENPTLGFARGTNQCLTIDECQFVLLGDFPQALINQISAFRLLLEKHGVEPSQASFVQKAKAFVEKKQRGVLSDQDDPSRCERFEQTETFFEVCKRVLGPAIRDEDVVSARQRRAI